MTVTSNKDQRTGRTNDAVRHDTDSRETERADKARQARRDLEELAENVRKAFGL